MIQLDLKKLVFVVIAMTLSQGSFAITYKNFKGNLNGNELSRTVALVHIQGVGDGLLGANTDLIVKNLPPIFCQAGKLAVTREQYIKFLDEAATNLGESANEFPVSLLLLSRLKAVFPCN